MSFWKQNTCGWSLSYMKKLLHIHIQQQNKLSNEYIYLLKAIIKEYMKIRIFLRSRYLQVMVTRFITYFYSFWSTCKTTVINLEHILQSFKNISKTALINRKVVSSLFIRTIRTLL